MPSSLADPVERTVREYSDLALLWPRKVKKKHLRHCNFNSVAKFELEGVGINTIILLFSDKN